MTKPKAHITWRKRLGLQAASCFRRAYLTRLSGKEDESGRCLFGMIRQEGAALVETAIALAVFLAVLFGLISFGYALYTYNFVSDAARVATRYAVVRDVNSCTIEPTFPNCNLYTSPPLQTYVQNLGYPGMSPSNLTLTATWLSQTSVGGITAWTPCLISPCNQPGNAVQVVVYYTLPLNIPFWQKASLTVSSTSQMVIN